MKFIRNALTAAVAIACILPAHGQTLSCDRSFGLRVDVDTSIGQTVCSSNAMSFIDGIKALQSSNVHYTQTSSAMVQGRFSDVTLNLSYDSNSKQLKYNFVELNKSGSFTGANRADSQDQFVNYIKKSDIIGLLMHHQAESSPTSPIAGLGGLIPNTGAADFSSNFDTASKISNGGASSTGGANVNNLIGVGVGYGSYNISGTSDKIKSTTLPFSYVIRNDIDPRRQLVFSMPLTKVSIGQADSYQGGLGVAYRQPITDNWSLSPGVKYSVVASRDRATLSTVMSANLMSTYVIPMASVDIAVGNMIGIYKTGKFSSGDYSFNPDVKLTMTRNGIMMSTPAPFLGGKMAAEVSLIDTRYLGNKPFVASTQEVGVTIGTNRNAGNARSYTRFGISYVRGKDSRGLNLNAGFWF